MKFYADKIMSFIEASTIEEHNDVVKEALRHVVGESPIDTGVYKANHYVSQNEPVRTTTKNAKRDAIAEGARIIVSNKEVGTKTYVQNNLPYAEPLEFGHSEQAPLGIYRTFKP